MGKKTMKLISQREFLKIRDVQNWQVLIHHTAYIKEKLYYFLTFRDHYEHLVKVADINYDKLKGGKYA